MHERPLRIGVIGAGRMGRIHAEGFAGHEEVESVVMIGRERGPDVYAGLDGLVLAASTTAHPELVEEAAALGVPLLIEKPLASTVTLQQELIELLEEHGTVCMMGYHRRFDPAHRRLREKVTSGELGAVRGAVAVSHDYLDAEEAFIPRSGGLWRDLAVHDFNALAWVLDDRVVSVRAHAAAHNPLYRRYGDADTGAAVLTFSSGAVATLFCGRNISSGQESRLEVHGTEGSAAAGGAPLSRTVSVEAGAPSAGSGARDSFERFPDAYRREREEFIRLIRGGRGTVSPPQACLEALRTAEAVEESAATGREVRV
ncbi:Gfo/Idh/MocA family oxidoreductase [Nesterenkonia massiliensis]|uniref:Gfo/Idh/MocA family oxidoreductase n=1 Tax=Nesterenkonia massiliensis TaxID=1232429 RepID=A0ABT2HPC2_9MICC|nr:Gfo/Idh/MocA family oxidoreductase [Nesterenkonia massiliensis]MCT1606535.1 Gfo/Idh/MocA family oxidoreductase [Nesterenkonia massiliensis]